MTRASLIATLAAGLLGAAPSVALATLSLAVVRNGSAFVATEGRSMVLGAFALLIFSFIVCQLLMRVRMSAAAATGSALVIWMLVAFALKQIVIG